MALMNIKGPSLYYVSRDWVGGVRKMEFFFLTFSTIYADMGWLGGAEKVPKCDDVI